MGILDDAKDKLGDAAEWVKDKAGQLGDQAHGAGQTLGEKAADARHWVGSKVGTDAAPEQRVAGGGTFEPASEDSPSTTEEWVEVTGDGSTVDGDGPSDAAAEAEEDAIWTDAGAHAAPEEADEQDRQA